MAYYQVIRKVAGLDAEPGAFISGDQCRNALALERTGFLRGILGEPPGVVATTTAAPSPAAIPASTAAVTVEAEPEGNKRHQRRR